MANLDKVRVVIVVTILIMIWICDKNHNYNFDFDFLQFGKLRQNFSEVADFVTIYIAEVAHSYYITTAIIILMVITIVIIVLTIVTMFRLIQRREGTSELEGTVATMTLTPMPTLQTGLMITLGSYQGTSRENPLSWIWKRCLQNYLKQEHQAKRCHHVERGGWRGS